MKKMFQYELKKIFSRTSNKIALLLLLILVGITCSFALDVSFVNEKGETETGLAAIFQLKARQKEWCGYLDEEKIRQVIVENRRIRETPEALSEDVRDNEIAYSWGQGIDEIRNLLNHSYADSFREYDYYRADSLTEDDAPLFYANRISLLKEWLSDEAENQFSDVEKEYLIRQYESLTAPFYYDYMKGWTQLFEYAPTVIMITTVWQKYLLIVFSGYIGCLFISFLSMLISAKTKSAVLAVMLPFVLIFIPSFLENMNSHAVNKVLGLLPDQLLQAGVALNYFNLYSMGGKVIGAIPILLLLYPFLTIVILPILYQEYRYKQIY